MQGIFPREVMEFGAFLERSGLIVQRQNESATFGDKLLQYGNAHLNVRVFSDRDVWFVEMEDTVHRPGEWYDTALLRDWSVGSGSDVLSLSEQISVIQVNWPNLIEGFDSLHSAFTHKRLAVLRRERARRRFPQ